MKHRVSNVESFRQWELDDEADDEELLAKLRGQFQPSAVMQAGTAFHKALELAQMGSCEVLEAMGHRFTFAGHFEVCVSPIKELRGFKVYMVDGQPITITGQVDQIEGRRIDDHKTTSRFDPERYIEGYQWRLYLDIFGADTFRWNVFEMAQVESTGPSNGFDMPAPEYEIFAQHRLEQFRYPNLGADCQALVERFARFVRERL